MQPALSVPPPELLRPSGRGPLVLTCEHASAEVPAPLQVSDADRPWLKTHWGVDIGAADVTRWLSAALDAPAVLGVASRLVLDLNRAPTDPTLVRTEVEGHPLGFNTSLDETDRQERLVRIHTPYHAAVEAQLRARQARPGPVLLLSIHSFTPTYLGARRDVEMGVLFDDHKGLARRLSEDLAALGWDTRLNEPWSGREGLIYAASRHGRAQGCPYLELELRQDLIATRADAEAVAERLVQPLLRVVDALG